MHEIRPRCLLGGLEHAVDFCIVVAFVAAYRLVLENQKEAPRQRFPISHILDESDIIFAKFLTLRILLVFQFLADHGYVLIRVRAARNGLELQPHGGYLQPAGKAGDDVELLLIGSQREVDRLDLKDFYVAVVRRFNDPVFQVADGQIILYKLKLFFSAVSFSFCFGHSGIRSS